MTTIKINKFQLYEKELNIRYTYKLHKIVYNNTMAMFRDSIENLIEVIGFQ